MYRSLDATHIQETIGRLRQRIGARFPESGLGWVAAELEGVGAAAARDVVWIARPNLPLRVAIGLLVVLIMSIVGLGILNLRVEFKLDRFSEFVQAVESGVNDLVFVGIAIFFLVRLEARLKRRRVLKAIHVLRSIAHIIDMHQLTKDPQMVLNPALETVVSPKRAMRPEELARYLDYCSEMLSLVGKLAALYVQRFDDSAALSAVDGIETLTTGLSRKIWQKITLIQQGMKEVPLDGA